MLAKKTLKAINEAMMHGRKHELSEEQLRLLEMMEFANEIGKKSKNYSKNKRANKIADKFIISLRQAYNVINDSILLFGEMEYPGLSPVKIFQLRKWEANIVGYQKKIDSEDVDEKYKVEYEKLKEKAEARIDKILGAYNQKDERIDYERWVRPNFIITTDERALLDVDNILTEIEGVTVDIQHKEITDEAD